MSAPLDGADDVSLDHPAADAFHAQLSGKLKQLLLAHAGEAEHVGGRARFSRRAYSPVTVTVVVAVKAPAVAVITLDPALTPVTTPLASTVALAGVPLV